MKPQSNNRRSIRLKEFDYSNPNWYYVTICTNERINYFGKIVNSKIILSDIGNKAKEFWEQIPEHFDYIELDSFIIMPNHIHGIIIINSRNVQLNIPTKRKDNYFSKISSQKGALGIVIRTYKAMVKKWSNETIYTKFKWQRNYFEHIIRNENDLFNTRRYIALNPFKWEIDKYYSK